MKPYYADDAVTIYHADAREWMPEADVLVTDPPFGIRWRPKPFYGATWADTEIEGDGSVAARDAVLEKWGQLRPALIFGSWKASPPLRARAMLVWDKGPQSGMGDLAMPWKPSWEGIYVLGSGFVGSRDEGVIKNREPVTWQTAGRSHPNEKPLRLMRYLLTKCPTNWVILDPFLGSGSTLVAAKDLGRKAIGIEIEERYCEVAARRCSQEVLGLSA
jgi:site-specific DNA-methyltransferase (adenine-specific)